MVASKEQRDTGDATQRRERGGEEYPTKKSDAQMRRM